MPHLKELYENNHAKGFEIIAVSDEKEATVDKFVTDQTINYGIVLSAKKFQELYGRNGRPTSWVLDADGKVIWKGHPAGLKNEQIEEWVKDLAPTTVDRELHSDLKGAVKDFNEGEYGKALKDANEIEAEAEDAQAKEDAAYLKTLIQKHVDVYTAKMKSARDSGDLVKLGKTLEEAAEKFDGSEQGDKWEEELKELEKSDEYKDTVDAQEDLDDIREKLEDMRPKTARKKLEKIAEKYPNTPAGKEAAELAKRYADE